MAIEGVRADLDLDIDQRRERLAYLAEHDGPNRSEASDDPLNGDSSDVLALRRGSPV